MENKEKKFLKFEIRWWLLAVFIVIFWLFFPFLFKAFMFWMDLIGVEQKVFADFGAIGDIYGSLNTLISSIALCAVAYSTILQVKELRLARQTYTDQLNESKFSNFTTSFYALLNHKNMNYNNLTAKDFWGNKACDAPEVFEKIANEFINLTNAEILENPTNTLLVKDRLVQAFESHFSGSAYSKVYSHFMVYGDLASLIKKSELENDDKKFFFRLVTNSMAVEEQLCLVWFSSFNYELKRELSGSRLINIPYYETLIEFLLCFQDVSLFSNPELLDHWSFRESKKKNLSLS